MRAGLNFVIKEAQWELRRNRFPEPAKSSGNRGPAILLCNKQGMVKMQYLFDLIWTQSCTRYLASMGQQEVEL